MEGIVYVTDFFSTFLSSFLLKNVVIIQTENSFWLLLVIKGLEGTNK